MVECVELYDAGEFQSAGQFGMEYDFNRHPTYGFYPEAVFGDTTTMRTEHYPKGFVLVKDLAGKTYWPSLGINDWDAAYRGRLPDV